MTSQTEHLRGILSPFLSDSDRLNEAVAAVMGGLPNRAAETADADGATVDLNRPARCGFPEVIFGEGKPAELIVRILQRQQAAGQRGFVTRVSADQAAAVQQAFPDVIYQPRGRTLTLCAPGETPRLSSLPETAMVAVVTAGSCDAEVAYEAMDTLHWMDVAAVLIEDVGVAGPQRLLPHLPVLQRMKAIVCVAGMEAALPSVVGGYVSCPVIGVPTSVGYGASFGGVTALLSMLTCCASNVVAVNIDAGFRGGYVAGMIGRGMTSGDAQAT